MERYDDRNVVTRVCVEHLGTILLNVTSITKQ